MDRGVYNVENLVSIGFKCLLLSVVVLLVSCSESVDESKKVFNYNQSEGLTSLDPAFASSQANIWATSQLFNGLVELDDQLHLVPSIAKSWTIDSLGTRYTFHLRTSVSFHPHVFFENKSRIVTANDFVYSFQRICDPSGLYNRGMWIFKGKVIEDENGNISKKAFVADNDSTLSIYLKQPFPQFLEILSMNYASVIPEGSIEVLGANFREDPIGTGPFVFKQWVEGNALVLLKNEEYWKKGLPKLDAVKVSFIPDKGQAFREFLLGNIDFFSGIEESSVDEIFLLNGSVKPSFMEKYDVEKKPYLNTEYLGIQLDESASCYKDQKNHPLLNVWFRKALSTAIDRKRLIVFLRNSVGLPATSGIVPPAVPDYNVSFVKGYDFDPELAQKYLTKSGVKLGEAKNIELQVAKEHKPLSEFLVKQWKEHLGIKVKINVTEAGVGRDMARTGKASFFRASWLGDYPDGENYLSLFVGTNSTPSGPNKTRYKDDIFDSLYTASQTLLSKKERIEQYYILDQRMINKAPIIPLYYDEVVQLRQKNISGLHPNGMNLLKLEKVDKE